MKILFVNQCYWPDHAATAQVLVDLAEEFVSKGHAVAILCSRRPYSGGGDSYSKQECHNGVMIYRVGGTGWGKRAGIAGRVLDSGCFFLRALLCCLTLAKPDVTVTLTSPPLIGVIGRLTQLIRGTIHVHWCMDVFPDLGIRFGVIRSGSVVHRMSAFVTSRYLKTADAVLVLSRHMAVKMRAYGVRDTKMCVVPVWADGRQLRPVDRAGNPFRWRHQLSDKFVLMYSGNLAHGGDIETMVEALTKLKEDKDVVFVLISEGPRFDEFRQRCAVHGVQHVLCLPYQRRADLSASLSAAVLHIVTNRKGMKGLREACKVYGILAVGRPFVHVGDECVATDFARDHGVGCVVKEGDAAGLVSAIRQIKESRGQWVQMCRRARAVFERECDALLHIDSFERVIEGLVRQKRCGVTVGLRESDIRSTSDLTRDSLPQLQPASALRTIAREKRNRDPRVSESISDATR